MSQATFIGRVEELRAASRQLAGPVPLVTLTGAAGIGKSTFVAELATTMRDEGRAVWAAAALEHDRRPLAAFRPFVTMSRHFGEENLERPSVLSGWSRSETDLVAVDVLLAALSEVGRSVVVIVDDAQWADSTTIAAVRVASRKYHDLDVGFVLARRPFPVVSDVERVLVDWRAAGGLELSLERFATAEVEALVADELGFRPDPTVLRAVARANGNPFFVRQIIAVMRTDDGSLDSRRSDEIGDLRDAVLYWLGSLDPETIGILQIAAVLGPVVEIELLAELHGGSLGALLTPIRQCIRAGVLRDSDATLTFTHDLVRESIYVDMPASVREAVHLEIGRRARLSGAPANVVARHLALGTTAETREGIHSLRVVGRELLDTRPAAALQLFQRALDLDSTEVDPADALDLARALGWSGSVNEAASVAAEALSRGVDDAPLAARLEAIEAMSRLIGGGPPAIAADVFERAAGVPGMGIQEQAFLLTDASLARLMSASFSQAGVLATDAIERFAGTSGAAMCHGVLAWVRSFAGDVPASLGHVEQLMRLAALMAPGDLVHTVANFFAGMTYIDADRLDDAVRVFQEGRVRVTESGATWALPLYHQGAGAALFIAGRWSEAAAELEAGLGISADLDAIHADLYAHATLALLEIGRGRLDVADAHLAAGDDLVSAGAPPIGLNWLHLAHALRATTIGDDRRAVEIMGATWDLDLALGIYNDLKTIAPRLVAAAMRCGEVARAEAVVATLDDCVDVRRMTQLEATRVWCRALRDDDLNGLGDAVTRLRSSPRRMDYAGALHDYAARIATSDPVRAGEALSEAYEIWNQQDAQMVIRFASRRARQLGLDWDAVRSADPWDGLNEVELQVVDFVSEGRTNREIGDELFLSHRTVETHLKHIFRKVGVRNRVELSAAAHARSG